MKKVLLSLTLILALVLPASQAHAVVSPSPPMAIVGAGTGVGMALSAVVTGAALVYIIGTNTWDPWHQLFTNVSYEYPKSR